MFEAACKEFYKNLTVSISKKKEVARSSVKGVKIELDGMILASILGVPENNGIYEYIKYVWEESTYCKPLEITKKFANDELITVARRAYHVPLDDKQGEEPKSYDYFEETFLTMCQLKREQGVWWLGLGANRRRDEDEAPTENVQNEKSRTLLGVIAPALDVIAPDSSNSGCAVQLSISEGEGDE
ncbi:hypothetical protein Dimus_022253 [Dionaea muscipula]